MESGALRARSRAGGESDLEPLDMLHRDSYGCEPTEQQTPEVTTETSSPTARRGPRQTTRLKGEALKAKGRPVRRAHLHDPTQAHLTDHHLNPRVAVVASLAPALPTWTSRLWFQRPLLADDAVGVSWPASVVGGVRGPERQAGTGALA